MPPIAKSALASVPYQEDIKFAQASAFGTINVGDWLAYSGQYVLATNQGDKAYWKTSGAGVAVDASPTYDQAGRSVANSALLYATDISMYVSAAFSGQPALGVGAYPVSTGSAVNGVTGLTGVGATWQTAQVLTNSALSGTANGQHTPVATVIGSRNFSNAGTGEMLVRVTTPAPDVRG
jgi:hypothetical protein